MKKKLAIFLLTVLVTVPEVLFAETLDIKSSEYGKGEEQGFFSIIDNDKSPFKLLNIVYIFDEYKINLIFMKNDRSKLKSIYTAFHKDRTYECIYSDVKIMQVIEENGLLSYRIKLDLLFVEEIDTNKRKATHFINEEHSAELPSISKDMLHITGTKLYSPPYFCKIDGGDFITRAYPMICLDSFFLL